VFIEVDILDVVRVADVVDVVDVNVVDDNVVDVDVVDVDVVDVDVVDVDVELMRDSGVHHTIVVEVVSRDGVLVNEVGVAVNLVVIGLVDVAAMFSSKLVVASIFERIELS
jgi:hypothetical protein